MKRITNSFIKNLVDQTSLVDLIGSLIVLKKKSGKHWGCCPFHEEKTPSFTVDESKNFYYCFGCKATGNALRFLMDYENLNFVDAIERLAQFNGVSVQYEEYFGEQADPAKTAHFDKGLACLKTAADLFHQCFNDELGRKARKYLLNRGINQDMVERFLLGYAPPNNWLKQKLLVYFDEDLLVEVGLLGKNEKGQTYDWFRDRLIFPIRNIKGSVVGFGGRVLDDSLPKYLNSPETNWFSKKNECYGLFETQSFKQKKILIVEGYLDVVGLAMAGVNNAVAVLGTAFTDNHLKNLRKRADNVYFAFDGDNAGFSASIKALEVIFSNYNEKTDWHFVELPQGEDPDSLIKNQGIAAWQDLLDKSLTPSQLLLKYLDDGLTGKRSVEDQNKLWQKSKIWLDKLNNLDYRQALGLAIKNHFQLQSNNFNQKTIYPQKGNHFRFNSTKQVGSVEQRLLAFLATFPQLALEIDCPDQIAIQMPAFYQAIYYLRAVKEFDDFLFEQKKESSFANRMKEAVKIGEEGILQEMQEIINRVDLREKEQQYRLEKK